MDGWMFECGRRNAWMGVCLNVGGGMHAWMDVRMGEEDSWIDGCSNGGGGFMDGWMFEWGRRIHGWVG